MTSRTPRRAAVDSAPVDPVVLRGTALPPAAGPGTPPSPAPRSAAGEGGQASPRPRQAGGNEAPGPRIEPAHTSIGPDRVPQDGLSGKDFRDAMKRAQSDRNAGKRRARFRRAPKGYQPGMGRVLPPEPPRGAA